jgi:hypothetical protein
MSHLLQTQELLLSLYHLSLPRLFLLLQYGHEVPFNLLPQDFLVGVLSLSERLNTAANFVKGDGHAFPRSPAQGIIVGMIGLVVDF